MININEFYGLQTLRDQYKIRNVHSLRSSLTNDLEAVPEYRKQVQTVLNKVPGKVEHEWGVPPNEGQIVHGLIAHLRHLISEGAKLPSV